MIVTAGGHSLALPARASVRRPICRPAIFDDRPVDVYQLTTLEQLSNDGFKVFSQCRQGRALRCLTIWKLIAADIFDLQSGCFFHHTFGTWYPLALMTPRQSTES